jgi:translation initiation factor IF-1
MACVFLAAKVVANSFLVKRSFGKLLKSALRSIGSGRTVTVRYGLLKCFAALQFCAASSGTGWPVPFSTNKRQTPCNTVPTRGRILMSQDKTIEIEGTITSVLPGTMFHVELANNHTVLAHISGKMRKRFIRLLNGDRVKLEMSPYDLDKARIVYRLG